MGGSRQDQMVQAARPRSTGRHLATVELLGEPAPAVVVVTRDVRVRENADALAYAVE